jgi:hypothetical protein
MKGRQAEGRKEEEEKDEYLNGGALVSNRDSSKKIICHSSELP